LWEKKNLAEKLLREKRGPGTTCKAQKREKNAKRKVLTPKGEMGHLTTAQKSAGVKKSPPLSDKMWRKGKISQKKRGVK